MGQHLFLNIIPSNFTVGTGWKVWCDRAMSLKNILWNFVQIMHCGYMGLWYKATLLIDVMHLRRISLSLNEVFMRVWWVDELILHKSLWIRTLSFPSSMCLNNVEVYSVRGHIEAKKIWWAFVKVRFMYAYLHATILAAYFCGPHVTWFISH